MKRFITYLYEYEQAQKMKSAGFVRVDERDRMVSMQVCVRKIVRTHEKGKIYGLVKGQPLLGILLGEIPVMNGQGDVSLRFSADRMVGSPYSLEDIVGIGIEFRSRGYLASCWEDHAATEIARGGFEIWERETALLSMAAESDPETAEEVSREKVPEESPEVARKAEAKLHIPGEGAAEPVMCTYRKITTDAIRTLPRGNWYLSNNRFLMHGFSNYGYLLYKQIQTENTKKAFLGVPGIFEKPEMVVAALFGFPEFEELTPQVADAKMDEVISVEDAQKEKDPQSGSFGAWFIPLQHP